MRTYGYARKADGGCEAVDYPRPPAVTMITTGDDGSHRKNTGGVPRWEAAAFEGRLATAKERVVKRRSGGNIRRSFSASNRFYRKVDDSSCRRMPLRRVRRYSPDTGHAEHSLRS